MTAYFMAGCSDNDSSEYIELAAKITLTQSEYYNNEGETTLHPWTKAIEFFPPACSISFFAI